ncbi:unnamed protein product [Cochlearia groenlandica]
MRNCIGRLGGLHTILTFSDSVHSIPVNLETRQQIAFFIWDCLDEIYIRCGVPDIWVSKSKEGADEILYLMKQHEALRIAYILGVREHIFTGSVSSLAWFMFAHETSFVTLGQRVLANPLKFRMHYGYPDGFDWFWFLTRGGISKASRVINISEDIFPGFNCTLQGRNVTHHEFIQVASGNREQVLSRDVLWLGLKLDFFMIHRQCRQQLSTSGDLEPTVHNLAQPMIVGVVSRGGFPFRDMERH